MSRGDGFSLLEVMAAVAILGIWYVTLSGSAITGVRSQAISQNRMHASLIADMVLAELEAQAMGEASPEVGGDEYEHDDFYTVRIEVSNLADPDGGNDIEPEPLDEEAIYGEDMFAFLQAEMPAMLEHMRAIQVEVSWQDGDRVMRVLRTTYAYDGIGARQALGELNPDLPSLERPGSQLESGDLGGGR